MKYISALPKTGFRQRFNHASAHSVRKLFTGLASAALMLW